MALAESRRLIVNADDFGRTPGHNEAVALAHREGILTTASLMVNEPAAAEAVALARQMPRLGVGLHLTLVCGRAALPPSKTSGLVNNQGWFDANPVRTGCRYFFRRDLRQVLETEIQAQFDRFARTGLVLDHINGHLNMHLHPTVFALLLAAGPTGQPTGFRLTRDRFWLQARLCSGHWAYRISHAVIFALLAARARPRLRRTRWRSTDHVFGLLQNGRVEEDWLRALLPRLPAGDSELYAHPSIRDAPHELAALTSPRVRRTLKREQIRLIRYQDL